MTETGATPQPPRENATARRSLMSASTLGATPALAGAICVGFFAPSMGANLAAGALAVYLPQLWFVTRGTRSPIISAVVPLAVAKYTLVTLGFAVWFALAPRPELLPTLGGSTMTLVLMALALYRAQHQMTAD